MGELPESQKTSNYLNVFFPFPTCLSELDLCGNISVADLLKVPFSDQQRGCSVCVSCGQKITLKSTMFICREQEPRDGSPKTSSAQGAGMGGSARKKCWENPLRADVGIAKSLGDIQGTFPARAGQAKPAHPAPSSSSSWRTGH